MKRLLLLGCCIAVCLVSAANRISAQTQFEMNQSAAREFNAADAEMDAQLKQLFKMAEGKPQSLAKLKQAQSA
jgi:uncharacterized protein YecT (DUF1311 family)